MHPDTLIDRRLLTAMIGAAAATLLPLRDFAGFSLGAPENSPVASGKSRNKKKKKKNSKKKSSRGSGTNDKGKSKTGSNGDAIVREARKYKGARYVWAGASPKGFDCSGFTWYVFNQVTGDDIGRSVEEQFKRGKSTSRGALSPGDIVFFKNTFQRGLSHCGIYISGSEFIHAENEETGVVISSLDSDYYSDHYAGARRLV